MAATDSRPATAQPKALIPFVFEAPKLAERRGAWRGKKTGDTSISMTVGSVAVRIAGSAVTFPAEIIVRFANDTDTEPTAYASLPRGRFNAPLFQTDGANAKAAQAELDTMADRGAAYWLDWFDKQPDQQPLNDPAVALAALSGGVKRGVKISKHK